MKSVYVALGLSAISPLFVVAQTTTTSPSDATNPNMERYCDPAQNADVMTKVRALEPQLEALQPNDPKAIKIKEQIAKNVRKLKCTYRPIQD